MDHLMELLEAKRTVVEGCRKAETILHKVLLAGTVTAIHRTDLRYADVALIDDHQIVLGEKVEQTVRALARLTAVEVS